MYAGAIPPVAHRSRTKPKLAASHGRTIFAGDSAHLVSPFGARGCNGGFADVDNLG